MPGQVVAICRLPSGDALLTTDEEKTREAWLKDTKWLEVYGQGTRIKRRAFIILVHGITVNQVQVQDQETVQREIYKQNPKLQDQVEILCVAWAKKLIHSGRTSGPLQVLVAEPEQANLIIELGLIWNHQIHECEPYNGNCIVTQCFKCYSYGHIAKCAGTQPDVDSVLPLGMLQMTALPAKTKRNTSAYPALETNHPGHGNALYVSIKLKPQIQHAGSDQPTFRFTRLNLQSSL